MSKTSKSLFSAHYLEHHLPQHPAWQEDPTPILTQLRQLYADLRDRLPHYNEAQTEQEFIQPVLAALGLAYTVQTSSKGQRPDYTLFADEAQKRTAEQFLRDEAAFYPHALAIAEAKYWDRSLTVQHADSGRAQFDNRNPSFQIVNYLIGTAVDWGILTNGRIWRLYYRHAASTATEFYEVDLVALLEQNDPAAFKLFWLFFRQAAFVRDTHGRVFLETVRQGSNDYARQVSEQLKERVFDEVFPLLAGGFVADMTRRGLPAASDENKALIYEATLSLLYKLLFVLYAEARDLLPLDHPGYQHESLSRMGQEIATRLDGPNPALGETPTKYYCCLLSLFRMINRGDPALGVPRYNGGLFHFDLADPDSAQKHRANYFLERYTINDARLSRALDLLTRIDGERVDYSFLAVRQLGAVYEGLLEYQLQIEDAAAGRVHLVTDKGERKATGSYYTPDYIVKYIVRQTLDPLLQEREARFAALMQEIVPKRERLQQLEARLADGGKGLTTAVESRYRNELTILRQTLAKLERQARDSLLDIKLCDPAMGSGHFLVEAVDYLTDRLITILNQHPDHNPILTQLDTIRVSILDSMAAQNIQLSPTRLEDTQLLQRTVMKRCIYGVDLNRMAVELAKLSLWLHSFTVGAPLSFLDHHLRWGNSLIGASAREAEQAFAAASGQINLFGGPFRGLLRAAEVMRGISGLSDATLAEVEQSEALFHEFDTAARPYKRLLDVQVAHHLGVKRAQEFLLAYGVEAIKAGNGSVDPVYAPMLEETEQLFAAKRFFHWELEFPEVFVDLDKADWQSNPGFDAVVGNPPYGLTPTFHSFAELPNDAFVYFTKQAVTLTQKHGLLSFITPSAWLTGVNYQPLRQYLLDKTILLQIIGLPYDVFSDAYIDTCVFVCANNEDEMHYSIKAYQMHKKQDGHDIFGLQFHSLDISYWLEDVHNKFLLNPHVASLNQISQSKKFRRIGEIINVERGVQLYSRSKHTIQQIKDDFLRYTSSPTTTLQEGAIYLPELFGEELSRYNLRPKMSSWLEYSDRLAGKRDLAFFRNIRVVLRRLLTRRRELQAAVTKDSLITTDSILNILVTEDGFNVYFVASLLNSKLISWLYTNTSAISVKDDFPQVTYEELNNLPLPKVIFTTLDADRTAALETALTHYEKEDDTALLHWAEAELALPRNDTLHDLLAHLAQIMLDLNQAKQERLQEFWLDLEGVTDAATFDTLRHKGKWQHSLHKSVPSARPFVDEESRSTITLDQTLGWNEEAFKGMVKLLVKNITKFSGIVRVYHEHHAPIAALNSQLSRTDALIDQLVYRLYALTPEEIALVEGN